MAFFGTYKENLLIPELLSRPELAEGSKAQKSYSQLEHLMAQLEGRDLGLTLPDRLRDLVQQLNAVASDDRDFPKLTSRTYRRILNLLASQLQLVPPNYYRNLWIGLGMSAIGIPIGTALGVSLGNMAFLGTGIPMGMAFGIAIGTRMDQKAAREGRQLELGAQ